MRTPILGPGGKMENRQIESGKEDGETTMEIQGCCDFKDADNDSSSKPGVQSQSLPSPRKQCRDAKRPDDHPGSIPGQRHSLPVFDRCC